MAEALFKLSAAINESNGPGWVVTTIEAMRAEWGCSLQQAMFHESINAAFVLWPALLARHGAEITINHADKARQAAKEKKRQDIAQHYHVIPTPKVGRRNRRPAT